MIPASLHLGAGPSTGTVTSLKLSPRTLRALGFVILLSLVPLLPTTAAEDAPPASVKITSPKGSPTSMGGVLVDGVVVDPTSITVEWYCPPPATIARILFDVNRVDALGNPIGEGGNVAGSAHSAPQGHASFTWTPPESGFYEIEVTLICNKVVRTASGDRVEPTGATASDSRKVYVLRK